MRRWIALLGVVVLAGCTTAAQRQEAADKFYMAQKDFASAQKPVFEMEGDGVNTIELKGVKSLRVYGGSGNAQAFQAAPAPRSDMAEVRGMVSDILPYAIGAKAINGVMEVSKSIERAGTAGYPYARGSSVTTTTTTDSGHNVSTDSGHNAVGANSGSNSGNSGKLSGGNLNDATSTPTVVNQPAPVVVQPATVP